MSKYHWDQVIRRYFEWIKDNTHIRDIGKEGVVKVASPFMDRRNDHLEIYIKKQAGIYFLTDDGYTIHDLAASGMEFSTDKRKQVFETTLRGYGVKLGDNDELFIESNLQDIGKKKHYLLQAMLAVNDLYVLSRESVMSFFKEDVALFLKSNEILFTQDIKLSGKSGFDHYMDFVVPSKGSSPEKLIKTMNEATKNNVQGSIFSFSDIQGTREKEVRSLVFYNDSAYSPSPDSIEALKAYSINPIAWTERSSHESLRLVAH